MPRKSTMTRRINRVRIRWWRDRARSIVLLGLLIYAVGFFLDWPAYFALSWIFRLLGAVIGVIGAGCGLLWLIDDEID